MSDILVCIKRVPDVSGEVLLTDDEQSVDARHVGFTMSPHEECAVELATQLAESSGGRVTVLSLGSADSIEQLRTALAVGCSDAVLIEADTERLGPVDVAAAIAGVVRAREDSGSPYDLVLLGNDAADTGDFQVPIRLAYALDRPVVTGISTVELDGARAIARGDGPDGTEIFELPMPAVVAVMEGWRQPALPVDPGSDEGEEGTRGDDHLRRRAARFGPGAPEAAAPPPEHRAGPRPRPRRRPRGRRPAAGTRRGAGMIIVLVETDPGGLSTVSREALTFARDLGERSSSAVQAVLVGAPTDAVLTQLGEQGVAVVHRPDDDRLSAYAGAAWAAAVCDVVESAAADVLLAAGTPRGNEVLAHVAARLDVAMAANVVQVDTTDPLVVTRQVVGGAALEEMLLSDRLAVVSVAGHACDPTPAAAPAHTEVQTFVPKIGDRDLVARVVRVEATEVDDTGALTSARVVVGAGRGAGGADGFGDLVELTGLLGGALGVSRVVTSLGWRPHSEQVGQTGSRIAPEVYIACGISGAIQHWAGCQSAKTILAVNTDAEAPMVTKAHYAVIGDLHEIVPAVNAELHRRLGR